jgi:O-antigen ligase
MSHPRETRKRRVALLGSIALLSALAVVALSAGKYPLLRFIASDPRDPAGDTRVALWRASVDAWRNFPILGSGLGTFREAFRMVQPADMPFLVEQAHSDSLQMLVTGGICGLFLAVTAAGSILWLLLAGARRQRHRIESAIALGGAGSLVILLLHGVVEFNFSVPAIPATLAAVCGMSWAAVLHQRGSENVAAEVAKKVGHPVAVDEPAA